LLKVNDPYFTGIPDGEFDFMTANGFRQNREYRLNYYGVSALLARAYLYKGDKSKALEYAYKGDRGRLPFYDPGRNECDGSHAVLFRNYFRDLSEKYLVEKTNGKMVF